MTTIMYTVQSLADLKTHPTPTDATVMTQYRATAGDGGGGSWAWRSGNQSADIAADPQSGIWAAPMSDTTGASGAWQRVYDSRINARWFGAKGDGVTDDHAALQAFFDYSSSNTYNVSLGGRLPSGQYLITQTITCPKRFYNIVGDGMFETAIIFNGVAGGCIAGPASGPWSPTFRDFTIQGDASSGTGIQCLTGPTGSVIYFGEMVNLYIISGGPCLHLLGNFSYTFRNIAGTSYNNHAFWMDFGPAVTLDNLYAVKCGSSKAGYRMAGLINLTNCNGINQGDYWGVFGSDTKAHDGFQNDFPYTDYASLTCTNCNAESYATGEGGATASAIYMQNSFRQFIWNGGKFQGPDTNYHSIIRLTGGGIYNVAAYLNPTWWLPGSGTRTADLFTDSYNIFVDESGILAGAGTRTFAWRGGGSSPYRTIVRQPPFAGSLTYEIIPLAQIGTLKLTAQFAHQGTTLGFFNNSPISRPTVMGSKRGNAALASLLTALANLGLITDSTT